VTIQPLLALEPRLIFDGAAVVTAETLMAEKGGGSSPADSPTPNDATPEDSARDDAAPEKTTLDGVAPEETASKDGDSGTLTVTAEEAGVLGGDASHALAVIDGTIDGYETLVAAATDADMEVVVVSKGGFDALAEALRGRSGYDAVHLFSHGAEGRLSFAGETLDTEALSSHADDLAVLGSVLTADGDLLLYGCDVGAGRDGEAFITEVARLTEADVAASDDTTGQGGDWTLEVQRGDLEAGALEVSEFDGDLAALPVTVRTSLAADQVYQRPHSSGDYPYVAISFTVTEDGSYTMETPSGTTTLSDPYLYLYKDSFDPENPGDYIASDDDGGDGLMPKLTRDLSAGSTYILVFTTFNASDTGAFDTTITGPSGAGVEFVPTIQVNETQSVALNGQVSYGTGTLKSSDWNDTATAQTASSDLTYKVTGLPAAGGLTLNGVPLSVNDTFSQADVDAGRLVYTNNRHVVSDSWTYTVTDPDGNATAAKTARIAVANASPTVVSSVSDQSALEGTAFSYTVPASAFTDADGDALTYSATLADGNALPSWLSFDATTRTFSGTPTGHDFVDLSVKVTASDGLGGTVSDVFALSVNVDPRVASALVDQSASEGTAFSYTVPASAFTDADGDALTYSATLADGSALPSWLSFDPDSRTFSGTPTGRDFVDLSVKVTASDGLGGTVSDVFALSVNVDPRVASALVDQSASEGTAFSYTVPASAFTDADGDALTYSATLADGSALPSWLSFDATTRSFSGTPDRADTGDLSIKITASDGFGGTGVGTVAFTVAALPLPPVLQTASPKPAPARFAPPSDSGDGQEDKVSLDIREFIGRKARGVGLETDGGPRSLTNPGQDAGVTNEPAPDETGETGTAGRPGVDESTGGVPRVTPSVVSDDGVEIFALEPALRSVLDGEFSDGTRIISVSAQDGTPLPDGLVFNPETGEIIGNTRMDLEGMVVRITVQDAAGTVRTFEVALTHGGEKAGEAAPPTQDTGGKVQTDQTLILPPVRPTLSAALVMEMNASERHRLFG